MIFQPDRYLLKKQIGELSRYIKGRILDIGSGPNGGRYRNLFSFDEYVTLDINPDFKPDVVASAEKLPFTDSSFDGIVCFQVLDDLRAPEKAIREMARVLKQSGYGLISVPQSNELHDEPHDYWRFTKYGVSTILENAGFEVVKILPRGGFWALRAQMVSRYFIDLLNLYKHRLFGHLLSPLFFIFGNLAIGLDILDKSKASRKHTIGWLVLFRKP